ncbi:MAG: hypothetical protein PHZ00_02650 [Candidatus Peribacteraceae bacterium]|nr:hypothetical protein [Candidatus Peribacteraceae bacterium]
MEALRLTAAEHNLFKALPDILQDGWSVEVTAVIPESDTELAVRARMAHFSDPSVRLAFDALQGKSADPVEFKRIVSSIHIRSWNQSQLVELFFVLGVRVTGGFMEYILSEAKTGEDLEALSAFSVIRDKLASLNAPTTL